MDGDSHFISFPKLVSRTGKLLLLTNWPIESRTAVYNEVSLNVSDQRVILAYFGLISCYNLVFTVNLPLFQVSLPIYKSGTT